MKGIQYHHDLIQGSEEWLAARCGMLTASAMKLIITPTLKPANNDKERAHLYELLAQRITGYVEPNYISDDMLRGKIDEIEARAVYAKTYAPVQEVGFITNDKLGFTLGFSPDGLVGDNGFIEAKSRRAKFHAETIVSGRMPDEFMLQVQTGFVVTELQWCDFISYCGGMPMVTIRQYPNAKIMDAIILASNAFEGTLALRLARYREALSSSSRLIPTERRVEQEMFV